MNAETTENANHTIPPKKKLRTNHAGIFAFILLVRSPLKISSLSRNLFSLKKSKDKSFANIRSCVQLLTDLKSLRTFSIQEKNHFKSELHV